MNRSDFFKSLFNQGKKVLGEALSNNSTLSFLENLDEPQKPLYERPPGASQSDENFKALCTGCDACMIACPLNIIMIDDMEKRYPLIYPEKDPCPKCEGFPCINACPSTALSFDNLNNYIQD